MLLFCLILNEIYKNNDRVNKETFQFNPKINLSIIGWGLPDLTNVPLHKEHIWKEDLIECWMPVILLNLNLDTENIWKITQKINSQLSRLEKLAYKVHSNIKDMYSSESIEKILQKVIFVLTKTESISIPSIIFISDMGVCNGGYTSYNSMAMQLCRLDARFIVLSLEDERNYRNKFGNIHNNEDLKVLAMMTKGYYVDYKEFENFFKYSISDPSPAIKIEKTNSKNRLTPFQKWVFWKANYYDSMFLKASNITLVYPNWISSFRWGYEYFCYILKFLLIEKMVKKENTYKVLYWFRVIVP